MMSNQQRKEIFMLYFRDKHPIPRGMLRLYPELNRKGSVESESVEDILQMEAFLQFNIDVYINLFSDDQKRSKVYDMVFIDVDDSDNNIALEKKNKIVDTLNENGLRELYVFDSGSKGYHIYVPFESTLLSNFRAAVIGWLKSLGIDKLIDVSAIEPNRVTRVPYSINSKSGKECIPIQGFNQLIYNNGLGKIIKTFDKENRTSIVETKQRLKKKSDIFSDEKYYPECMQILVNEAKQGTDLGHIERVEMGIFLMHVYGDDVKTCLEYYKKMSDYSEHVTGYQLNYISKQNLKSRQCDRLREEGICPFKSAEEAKEQCPFYPSLNHWYAKDD